MEGQCWSISLCRRWEKLVTGGDDPYVSFVIALADRRCLIRKRVITKFLLLNPSIMKNNVGKEMTKIEDGW